VISRSVMPELYQRRRRMQERFERPTAHSKHHLAVIPNPRLLRVRVLPFRRIERFESFDKE
jgi:hypothetical protein